MRLDRDLTPVMGAKSAEDQGAHSPQSRHIDAESEEALLTLNEVERNHILSPFTGPAAKSRVRRELRKS